MTQCTRKFKIHKKNFYTIPSTGMICKWKILSKTNAKCCLIIDDVKIDVPLKNSKIIDIAEIRKYIKELYPENEKQHMISRLEHLFYEQQLHAMAYYAHVNDEVFFSTIFTGNCKRIQLDFGKNGPEIIEVEETYIDRTNK